MGGGFLAVLVAVLGPAGLTARGGEPVRVCLWAVEVPAGMIADWQGKADGGWFAAARAEVAAGRSEEAALLLMSGRQGERMTIESVREVIYATEDEPDSFRSGDPPSLEELMKFSVRPPFLPPAPAAYETRNVGETIDGEVDAGSGERLRRLRLDAEWVRQDGDDVILEYGQDDGGKWKVSFPRFVTRRIRADLDCQVGMWMLAGMVDPWRVEAKPGTKALVFVRVEAMGPEK